MVVTSTNNHSTYGIACIQCRETLIAPSGPSMSANGWSVTFGPANIAASGLRLQTICNPPSPVGRLRESFWRRFHDPPASRCIRQKSLFLI
jgi:hypothetical protein